MEVIVGFVDDNRDELGVEPICRVLQIAPSTYYAAKRRAVAPSVRGMRDAALMQVLMVLWVANRKVYGAHKLWKAARRAGHEIGRDQVARLMRAMEIEGVSRRRRKVFTTIADPDAVRAPDLVNRNFTATRPDALWVTDLTYVPTRTGMAYVCFIVDAFSPSDRRMARRREHEAPRWSSTPWRWLAVPVAAAAWSGSWHTPMPGSQFTSVRFTERLDEIGARPSIGTVADTLRQRPRRDNERALQDGVRPRPRRPAPLG